MSDIQDLHFMQKALQLAEKGRFSVSPNPMVGCLIVKNNQILSEAFHVKAGEAHAEILALQKLEFFAQDATVYLTLEPCVHYGRTPPCVEALLRAGVKKVVIACVDPNPLMSGKSINILKNAGIEVVLGVCEQEARQLNEIFFHYITHQKPFVISKWAMSLDGKSVCSPLDSKQISNIATQKHAHRLRAQVDAILIGAETLRMDNPELTVRFFDEASYSQPKRIVLTRTNELPPLAKIFNHQSGGETLIVTGKKSGQAYIGANHIFVSCDENSNVHLDFLLAELAKREISSLLIEGGQSIQQQFMRQNLINQYHVYIAPVLIADMPLKQQQNCQFKQLGDNLHCQFRPGENYV